MIVPQKITAGPYSLLGFGNGVFYFFIALFCPNFRSQPRADLAAVKNIMNGLAKTGREGMVKAVMKCISKWGADSSQLVVAYDRGPQPLSETKSKSPT